MNGANNKPSQEIDINNDLQNTLTNYYKKCGKFLEIPTMNISFEIKTLESTSPKKSIFGFIKNPSKSTLKLSEPTLQLAYAKKGFDENSDLVRYDFPSDRNYEQPKLDDFFTGLTAKTNINSTSPNAEYFVQDSTAHYPHTRPFFILLNKEKINDNDKQELFSILNNIKKYTCYLLGQLQKMVKSKINITNINQFNKFQMYKCALLVIFSCEHIIQKNININSDSILSKLISDVEKLNEYQIYNKIHVMICENHNQQSGGKGKTKKSKRRSSKSNKKHKKTLRK
jgi:hypothetical protein